MLSDSVLDIGEKSRDPIGRANSKVDVLGAGAKSVSRSSGGVVMSLGQAGSVGLVLRRGRVESAGLSHKARQVVSTNKPDPFNDKTFFTTEEAWGGCKADKERGRVMSIGESDLGFLDSRLGKRCMLNNYVAYTTERSISKDQQGFYPRCPG